MTKKKFQCDECGYYWENNPVEQFPQNCPVCLSSRIHRSARHKRFAKKSPCKCEKNLLGKSRVIEI